MAAPDNPRCAACPVASDIACIGANAIGRWCHLANSVPAYREIIRARSEHREPAYGGGESGASPAPSFPSFTVVAQNGVARAIRWAQVLPDEVGERAEKCPDKALEIVHRCCSGREERPVCRGDGKPSYGQIVDTLACLVCQAQALGLPGPDAAG